MNTATKLSGFALGLAAVFGAAYGVGQVAGPDTPAADQPPRCHRRRSHRR